MCGVRSGGRGGAACVSLAAAAGSTRRRGREMARATSGAGRDPARYQVADTAGGPLGRCRAGGVTAGPRREGASLWGGRRAAEPQAEARMRAAGGGRPCIAGRRRARGPRAAGPGTRSQARGLGLWFHSGREAQGPVPSVLILPGGKSARRIRPAKKMCWEMRAGSVALRRVVGADRLPLVPLRVEPPSKLSTSPSCRARHSHSGSQQSRRPSGSSARRTTCRGGKFGPAYHEIGLGI